KVSHAPSGGEARRTAAEPFHDARCTMHASISSPMAQDAPIAGLAHVIQLALAPVFLLSGVASLLVVLTNRLAPVIDRSRLLEKRLADGPAAVDRRDRLELDVLRTRVLYVNRAITACTYAALLVAGVVAALFVGSIASVEVTRLVSIMFVVTMVAL